jgi:hypothetical protein
MDLGIQLAECRLGVVEDLPCHSVCDEYSRSIPRHEPCGLSEAREGRCDIARDLRIGEAQPPK